ncbi:MAG: hypothetical protein AAGI88_25135, partial [Pseudomonadota bacterium]
SELSVALLGTAVTSAIVGFFATRSLVKRRERQALLQLPEVVESLFARELLERERNDDLRELWEVIADRTRRTAEELGLLSFPKLKPRELGKLDELVETRIPKLRSELHDRLTKMPASG